MGWNRRDAVGEPLEEGDRVKVFRNFSGDDDFASIVEHFGIAVQVEGSEYSGRLAVRVQTDSGRHIWVHHMSVMKV